MSEAEPRDAMGRDPTTQQSHYQSLQSLTPADAYSERGQIILKQRERIKQKTTETRRLLHRKSAA